MLKICWIIFLQSFFFITSFTQNIVTNDNWSGRFGDRIYLLYKTLWVAYKHNLELILRPFKYSNQLITHTLGKKVFEMGLKNYTKIILKSEKQNIIMQAPPSIQYLVDFHFESHQFEKDIMDDLTFINYLKSCVKPINF